MKSKIVYFFFSFIFPAVVVAGTDKNTDAALKDKMERLMKDQPVHFLENSGQMADMDGNPIPFVFFKAETPGMNMYITETGITYVFLKMEKEKEEVKNKKEKKDKTGGAGMEEENVPWRWERVDMKLERASIKKENIIKEETGAGHFNFFYGHCPDGIYGVKQYEKLTVKDIYPGIDWVFYNSTREGFKYDFIVHSGADPDQIHLVYCSSHPLQMDQIGNLTIKTALGELTEDAPYSYLSETNKEVLTPFQITDNKYLTSSGKEPHYQTTVGFKPETINFKHETLIIDPQLTWATFYGGSNIDGPMSADIDAGGNVFITGYTQSLNFPVQAAGTFFQGTLSGDNDAFILKFGNSGNRLWATYYGGNNGGSGYGNDAGNSIIIDGSGNVFLTGYTDSPNFPVQATGTFFQGTLGGGTGTDAFILKFDNSGNRLWATYYGGTAIERGNSIAADGSGNVFVTGYTGSSDFPVQTAGTFFQGTYGGGGFYGDAFILKFDNSGNRLWATYYGGSGNDNGTAIAAGVSGNVFVTGFTDSPDFPVQTAGTFFQGTYGGGGFYGDAFILKFGNSGNRLWATYYGGSGNDYGSSIILDGSGNIFVTGGTDSPNFPVQAAGTFFQGTLGGGTGTDAFILKFDNSGNRLWATYYGGSGNEEPLWSYDNLALDNCDNVYASFTTVSSDFPVQNSCMAGYFDNSFNGGYSDIAVVLFTNSGNRLWATYWGGDGGDFRSPLAVDGANNFFMAGEWTVGTGTFNSATYPLADPGGGAYYDPTHNTDDDGFIAKFRSPSAPIIANSSLIQPICGCTGSISVTIVSPVACAYAYLWNNGQTASTATGLCAGTYTVVITNEIMCKDTTLTVTLNNSGGGLTLTASQTNAGCGTLGTASVSATGGTTPYTYNWSNGQTTTAATGLMAGNYTVTVTDINGCSSIQTVAITSSGSVTAAANNSTICTGQNATIIASGGGNYSWNNGNTNSTIIVSPSSTSTYSVIVSIGNCSDTAYATVTVTSGITAVAGPNSTICSGQTVTLNVSGGSPYLWNTGATTSSITAAATATYSVIIGSGSCSDTAFVTVTVNPSPSVSVTGGTSLCIGQNATLTATGGTNYSWSPGGQTTASITVSPTGNASYTVTTINTNGCSASAIAAVTVTPTPVVTPSSVVLCMGDIATLTASGGTSYSWSPTGQTTATITVSPSANTTYTVLVTAANSCTNFTTVNVTVAPPPVASANNTTICSGQNATLTASGGGNYSWSNGSTNSAIVVSPLTNTTYSVVVSIGSCTDTALATVTVNPSPTVSVAGNTTLCAGDIATLTASGGSSYLWSSGNTNSIINVTPSATTTYTVVISNGACTDAASITIIVSSPPIASASGTTVCAGQSAALTASGGGTYLWSNGSTNATINISPVSSTTYSVIVTIGPCFDTASASVVVNPSPVAAVSSDVTITTGSITTLSASGGTNYSWSNGAYGPFTTVSPPITTGYCVTVSNGSCIDIACVTVFVEPLDCSTAGELYLPNAFSPNNDGENDMFQLIFGEMQCIKTFELLIYSRWGEKVFEATSPLAGWDGSYKGKIESAAVFAYYMKATLITGQKIIKKGNVSLIR